MDLLDSFGVLTHPLLIPQLDTYEFKNTSLNLLIATWKNRRYRTKTNDSVSSFGDDWKM